MRYRNLGNSGIRLSEIGLGAWLTYGDSVDSGYAERIIHSAVDQGINFIDLADVYAFGEAEKVAGKAIQHMDRTRLIVSSKVYFPMSDDVNDRGLSRKHIMESVERSLRRINTDYLDLYFCHRYDARTPLEEVIRTMDDLVHQGKILYWGTSLWSAAQIERVSGLCRQWNLYRPQVEQPRYNMLDRRIEPEIIPAAAQNGMGIVAYSPLAQGMLTGKYNDGIPSGSRAERTNWLDAHLTEANLKCVRQLSEVAAEVDISLSQLALAWILRRDEITCAITGATRPDHVLENIGAVEARDRCTPEIVIRLEDILETIRPPLST